VTCRLLAELEGVPEETLCPIEIGETKIIGRGKAETELTALPANHCPGALMFLARNRASGTRVLYTGDFRLDTDVREALRSVGEVDALFIDSTYAEPRYSFPPKEEAVAEVVRIVRETERLNAGGDGTPEGELMLGVYTIGKNCVVQAVAREAGVPVYMTAKARKVYKLLGMGDVVTGDRKRTHIRAYARGYFDDYFFMLPRKRRERAVVVIPTGWATDEHPGPSTRGGAVFHYVAYSEHCDWAEREEALSLVKAARVVEI
jgi:DNA ligase-1